MSPAPAQRAPNPTIHSSERSAPVKAIGGVPVGGGDGGGVIVAAVVVTATGEVVGTAITGVMTVLVWQVVVVLAGIPQLGPLKEPVLVMVPVPSDAKVVTEKPRV
jgi:hypothetical protein